MSKIGWMTTIASICLMLVSAPALAQSSDVSKAMTVIETILPEQLEPDDQPRRFVVYTDSDRVDVYSEEIIVGLEEQGVIGPYSDQGVPFVQNFITAYKEDGAVYVIQRGWDEDGNCHLKATRLARPTQTDVGTMEAAIATLEEEQTDTCKGDPCSFCKFSSSWGCECQQSSGDGHCNHTVVVN